MATFTHLKCCYLENTARPILSEWGNGDGIHYILKAYFNGPLVAAIKVQPERLYVDARGSPSISVSIVSVFREFSLRKRKHGRGAVMAV